MPILSLMAAITLTVSSTTTANGPVPAGQRFDLHINYGWSGAPSGNHTVTVAATLTPGVLFDSSNPSGPPPNGLGTVSTQRSFTTTSAGPFSPATNASGSGTYSVRLYLAPGAQGSTHCVTIRVTEGATASTQTQRCFQLAAGTGGGMGGGNSGGNTGGSSGGSTTAVSHWALTHDLHAGTGVPGGTAIFRVKLQNPSGSTPGEPSMVSPVLVYSFSGTSAGAGTAKVVAVTQGPSPSSGLPSGWSVVGSLPSGNINVNGPATLAPGGTLPEFYVHVDMGTGVLASTVRATANMAHKLSSNPGGPLVTMAVHREVRTVVIPK